MSSRARRSSLQDHHLHHHNNRHHHSPSFSSTLLEEIYRSFDEENSDICSMKKTTYFDTENRFVVDRWNDNENIKVRRASLPEEIFRRNDHRRPVNYSYSSSSESCSSGVGGFSSSDNDSLNRSSSSSRHKSLPPLKPIRTVLNPAEARRTMYSDEVPPAKKKKEGNLHRRALKLYGDLKKVKQPISPGGKLATFLNSLFNSNNSKKPKISSSSPSYTGLTMERESASAPSTASRSCLSKTPSSAGRFEKRSVRFVDDDRSHHTIRNHTTTDVAKRNPSILTTDEEFKHQMREKHRRVEEVAKELLKNYHQKINRKEAKVSITSDHHDHLPKFSIPDEELRESEEEDDDLSCCSSDLFELDNWLEIGADHRFREELPVYETTRFDPNRAIAI